MADVTLKGNIVHTNGEIPGIGAKVSNFTLVDKDLKDIKLSEFSGKKKVLSILPSVDTETCATMTKKFNDFAKKHPDVAFLVISADLPFAQSRFCGAQGVQNVQTLSMMRNSDFGRDYGLLMVDGPLSGILARAVIVLDEQDKVLHAELVPEITSEPNYEAALSALT